MYKLPYKMQSETIWNFISVTKYSTIHDYYRKNVTKSISSAYCVANTNTAGAAGKVPYKNP